MLWPSSSLAAPTPIIIDQPGLPTDFLSFGSAIKAIYDIVLVAAGIVFVMMLLIGGLMYLGSAGNTEGTQKARQLIINAVIGLAVVVMAWATSQLVLCNLLKITGIIPCP